VLLAIDVGNTQTVIGVFDLDDAPDAGRSRPTGELIGLAHHWRIATRSEQTADELALLLTQLLGLVGLELPRRDSRRLPMHPTTVLSSSNPGSRRECRSSMTTLERSGPTGS
jgi:hypothetical protein